MSVELPSGPFRGLAPFGDGDLDASLFFGRERDCDVLVANLVAVRLTVLYGASGVGKSSLLRAGVAHRLRAEPDVAVVVASTWTGDATAPLREAEHAHEWAREVYLVLDQFEEYFLYRAGDDAFVEALGRLLDREGAPVHVLIAVREDALALLDAFKARIPGVLANSLRLARLDRESARAAVVRPLDRWNELVPPDRRVSIEPGLVEAVLDQTAAGELLPGERDGGIEAPYLQLVLERLWERELELGSDTLRLATLAGLGGAGSIVEAHLGRALAELGPDEQDVAAAVFNQLVTPSGSKVAHRAADLAEYADVPEPRLRPVLETLGRERIVRSLDGDGGARFEIFHDVLGHAVLAWRAQHRVERERRVAERRHRRVLALAVAALVALAAVSLVAVYAFVQRGRADAQARVAQARELEARALGDLAADPQTSLAAAVRAAGLEPGARAESVLRTVLIGNRLRDVVRGRRPVEAVAYSPSGAYLLTRDTGAVRVYDASTRRLLRTMGGAPTAALFRLDDAVVVGRADGSVVTAAPRSGHVRRLLGPGGGAVGSLAQAGGTLLVTHDAGPARLLPGTRPLGAAASLGALASSGRFAALVETDAQGHVQAHLYELPSGRLLRVLPPLGVEDVAFSPRSDLLAVGSHDGTTTLWRPDGRLLETLDDGGGSVAELAFSHDGSLLATGSSDGGARVWTVADGSRLYFFVGHTGHVNAVAWSADDKLLADASSDGSARLWGVQRVVEAGWLVAALSAPGSATLAVALSPAGSAVATGSADGATRIWDGHAEETLHRLAENESPVAVAAYAPDGRLVLSAGSGGDVQVRDAASRRLVASFRAAAPLVSAAFAGPERVVTAGGRVAELRDARSGRMQRRIALGAPAVLAVPARDGSVVLVAAGRDAALRSLPDGAPRARFAASAPITAAAISRDGRRVALTSKDGVVEVFDADGARVWRAHADDVAATASFDAAGRLLATGGSSGAARLWDAATGRLLHTLAPPLKRADLRVAVFDPAGKRLLTGRADGDARIWSTATGRQLHALVGQFGNIEAAAWSPDGRWAATGGPIAAVLWPADTGRLLFYLRGHAKQVTSVAFSVDGRELLTGSADGTVRTYVCNVCGGLAELVRRGEARLARTAGA